MPLICYKNVWFDSLATKNEVVIGMCLQFIFVYVGIHRLRRINPLLKVVKQTLNLYSVLLSAFP